MQYLESIQTSIKGLLAQKLRTLLTMLGIIIGIASVILMTSLGKGVEGLILNQLESFGQDSVFVEPGGGDGAGPPNFAQLNALKYDDFVAINKLDSVKIAAPIKYVDGVVSRAGTNISPQIVATTVEYAELNSFEAEQGRWFDESDVEGALRSIVLGSKAAEDLFGDDNPVGQTVTVKRKTFLVIGVLPKLGVLFFQDLDKSVYLPISTARRELQGEDHVTFITARLKGNPEYAAEDIRLLLRDRHDIDNPDGDKKKDDFQVTTQEQAASTFGAISSALTIFLSAIASISLFVGGIGIMNIMLVSVTERTREIGLRKALGARRRDIMTQFLIEAILLTMIGGLLGAMLGAAISWLGSKIVANLIDGWVFIVPLDAVLKAFGVATAVGLVFGLYPARKASRLDPIEALRYE
ncbi:MAG: ABC transporter permease [Patescibacteria group bacterium]|jgi:putative ABC transport system permease protein